MSRAENKRLTHLELVTLRSKFVTLIFPDFEGGGNNTSMCDQPNFVYSTDISKVSIAVYPSQF